MPKNGGASWIYPVSSMLVCGALLTMIHVQKKMTENYVENLPLTRITTNTLAPGQSVFGSHYEDGDVVNSKTLHNVPLNPWKAYVESEMDGEMTTLEGDVVKFHIPKRAFSELEGAFLEINDIESLEQIPAGDLLVPDINPRKTSFGQEYIGKTVKDYLAELRENQKDPEVVIQ